MNHNEIEQFSKIYSTLCDLGVVLTYINPNMLIMMPVPEFQIQAFPYSSTVIYYKNIQQSLILSEY